MWVKELAPRFENVGLDKVGEDYTLNWNFCCQSDIVISVDRCRYHDGTKMSTVLGWAVRCWTTDWLEE